MDAILTLLARWGGWAIAAIGVIIIIAGLVSGTMRGVTGGAIVLGAGLLIGSTLRSRR